MTANLTVYSSPLIRLVVALLQRSIEKRLDRVHLLIHFLAPILVREQLSEDPSFLQIDKDQITSQKIKGGCHSTLRP